MASINFGEEDEDRVGAILAKAGLVHLKEVFVREKVSLKL